MSGQCPHVARLKDLGASCNVLIHNLQDNLHGNSSVTTAAVTAKGTHMSCTRSPLGCRCTRAWHH